jgi:hypothetical protein
MPFLPCSSTTQKQNAMKLLQTHNAVLVCHFVGLEENLTKDVIVSSSQKKPKKEEFK